MSADLSPDEFPDFFEAVHGHAPFPWQARLAEKVISDGKWPSVLDLPTASGKTAAIDIAIFHLAIEAGHRDRRRAPVRIAFVVDRRIVVDDAFRRAERIALVLGEADPATVAGRVAARLGLLSEAGGHPLVVHRLRGGLPREDDWARTPAQPTVLCSTVDQIGSRLLFRGYGISDPMKPVHAGLIGSDCLILLDEAHLAEPFRQTCEWVETYRGDKWRSRELGHETPWGLALLSATPRARQTPSGAPTHGTRKEAPFGLDLEDRRNEVLAARLNARKPARLVGPVKARQEELAKVEGDRHDVDDFDLVHRVNAIVEQTRGALTHFGDRKSGVAFPAIGVVVNRIARARQIFNRLAADFPITDSDETTAPKPKLIL